MPHVSSGKKGRDDSARRDHFGRDVSYLHSCLPSLQNLSSIDLYSHDMESKYSPLHVSLQRGYLRKSFLLYKRWKDEMEFLSQKFGGHVFNQLDREGLNPLELYSMQFYKRRRRFPLYIRYGRDLTAQVEWQSDSKMVSQDVRFAFMQLPKDEKEQEAIKERGGSHLLTLGSNVNYQLGTGTKDDRQNMYQLAIDQLKRSDKLELTDSRLSKILISRYHSIVTTRKNKVYTCGNSNRGRLGNGVADKPQASFTEIMDLGETKIKMIDTSNHHSLLLTEHSDVFSWGWNGYGQLGHSTSQKIVDLEKSFVPVPKRIPFLEGEEVVSIACSKIHSCAATKDGKLFMWGLNVGQIGGSKPVHKNHDTTYQGQDGHITSVPVIINCSKSPIDQVVCTEFATFVRLQTNNLLVYTNYTMRSFKIPSPRAKAFKSVDAFDHFTPREIPSTVVDMKCKNLYGNNICFRYSCGRVGIISLKEESNKLWTKFSNTLPVTLYWVPNFEHKKCMDFAVGAKGQLIVCTANGEVFTCKGINSTPEKMYSARLISGRAITVACDPCFVSFGVIKDETMCVPMLYPRDKFLYDYSRNSPIYGGLRDFHDFNRFDLPIDDCLTNCRVRYTKKGGEISTKVIEKGSSQIPLSKMHTTPLNQEDEHGENKFDIEFFDRRTRQLICKCHRFILASRCPKFLAQLPVAETSSSLNDFLRFQWYKEADRNCWRFLVDSPDSEYDDCSEILKQIVHFLYTDVRPTDQRAVKFLLTYLDTYHLQTLAYALESSLEHNEGCATMDHFGSGLSHTACKREDATKPDVKVILKDGIAYCHSVVLISRSATLHLLKDRFPPSGISPSTLNLENLDHGTKENFTCILRHLYGVPYERVFDLVRKEHFTEKVQFFLDMLCLCDELNLEYLKNYTESRAVAFINGETVVPMLINAVFSNSRLLAQNCCWFICLHIGLLFSRENLELVEEHFDSTIWNLVESTLRDLGESQSKVLQLAWYDQGADWIKLYNTNLNTFNERFMDPKRPFQPVFDLISEIKTPNRRKSSTHGIDKARKTSFNRGSNTLLLKEPRSVWETPATLSDYTAVEDSDEFVEVVKKSKRRPSSRAQSSSVEQAVNNAVPQPASKVVIHSNNDSSKQKLPSLMSQTEASPTTTGGELSAAKIRNSFKKGSQKQRLQQISSEALEAQEEERKITWSNGSSSKANAANSGNLSTRRKKSLPSLYDSDLASTKGKSKKEKHKMTWNLGPSASSEVRSHGTWASSQPYVPLPINLKPTATEMKSTLEEQLAAQEFEKWFELESSKVQKQLKMDNKDSRDSINALYRADDNLPEFIRNQSSSKKNSRKLKLKFQSKHKAKDADNIMLS